MNGGVPPFGHTTHLSVFIDPVLLQFDEVCAAARTWHDVVGIERTGWWQPATGEVVDLTRA